MTEQRKIVPVLLSGGTGSRLWPLSREAYPKQLLALIGPKTMLQQTALRVRDEALFETPIVVANHEHRFIIAEQMRALGIAGCAIVLEPSGRNTAPAVAVAALAALKRDPRAILLVMPADHAIGNAAAFRESIETGLAAAAGGRFVLFGVAPTEPATGYGYIETGAPLDGPSILSVVRFVEKPDRATAEAYLAGGRHLWNSGLFMLPAQALIEEFERLAPEVLAAARKAYENGRTDLDFLRLDEGAFKESPSISLDYAILEKTDRAAVVPARFDWTDVGQWSALWEIGEKDARGTVSVGDVISEETSGSYLRSEGPLVAALGVSDLIVVATSDVVLVAAKERDQDVKRLVERLRTEGRTSATQAPRVHRPWGWYQSVVAGDRFQVKSILVDPGATLSLQKHFHRAEHWVVVRGTALVTRDGEEILLRENESIFLPLGCVHRLANPGRVPLNIIEVQSGAYLGEDDIVRLEDVYARP